MSLIDGRTTRVLFTVFLFAVGVGFLYVARRTLIAFLFAVFFAYLVDPAVSRVEKWSKARASAIAAIVTTKTRAFAGNPFIRPRCADLT